MGILSASNAIDRNPYAGVDWTPAKRWKVQLHDHPGIQTRMYRAYDAAGYHAVALMDYSGDPTLSYTWSERHWPAEDWLPPEVLADFANIRVLIPGAEEVGGLHLTSPFLSTYIEKWDGESALRQPWQYVDTQGGIDAINGFGGVAFLAHPWNDGSPYDDLDDYAGMEIYSAFEAYRRAEGDSFFTERDRHAMMLARWDEALQREASVLGIAVNDHFGPGNVDPALDPRVRDSGKILVLADTLTLDALRVALVGGRVLAVKDVGISKGAYPTVDSLWTDDRAINVSADGEVVWISQGQSVCIGPRLLLASLAPKARYVRAEVRGGDGSTVFLQAIGLR